MGGEGEGDIEVCGLGDSSMTNSVEVLRRRVLGKLEINQLYLTSLFNGPRLKDAFDGVETYCMFIGYPRSGHSLVGALLDAHPEMIIAHEFDTLRFLNLGFNREQLYYLILENSKRYAKNGREQSGYSYDVPNQWQGKFRKLRVIGDKKGRHSTQLAGEDAALFDRLRHMVGVPVKFFHVVRNPYDNIATMSKVRPGETLQSSMEFYFFLCQTITELKNRIDSADILDIPHESFIENPKEALGRCCRFLGLDAPEDYLTDSASIVFKSPNLSRHKVTWSPELISTVAERMKAFPFLQGYTFE